MRDTSVDSLIRKAISSRMRESPDGCPDENAMAAYLEKSLSDQETAAYESHLAECPSCQEALALAMKMLDADASQQETPEPAAGKKVLFRLSIPIPVLGAVCIAAILVAVLVHVRNPGDTTDIPQSAEMHRPARNAEPAPAARKNESAMRSVPMPAPSPVGEISVAERPTDLPPSVEVKEAMAPSTVSAPAAAAPVHEDEGTKAGKTLAEKDAAMESSALREESKAAMAPPPRADRDQASRMKAGAPSVAVLGGSVKAQAVPPSSRTIGDKEFYLESGFWIDRQTTTRKGEPVFEIDSADPQYEAILTKYKDLRSLLPAVIYWEGRIYLLR